MHFLSNLNHDKKNSFSEIDCSCRYIICLINVSVWLDSIERRTERVYVY